jgi:hypothetical protein
MPGRRHPRPGGNAKDIRGQEQQDHRLPFHISLAPTLLQESQSKPAEKRRVAVALRPEPPPMVSDPVNIARR